MRFGARALAVLAISLIAALQPPRAIARELPTAPILSDEFDARPLNDAEKRLLQIGLGHAGDYVGLFDGKWGRRSQEALEQFSLREFDTFIVPNVVLVALAAKVFDAEEQFGFAERRLDDLEVELRLPFTILHETNEGPWAQAWTSGDGTLFVGLARHYAGAPTDVHERVSRDFGFAPGAYLVRRPDRLVTSHQADDGPTIYLRSDDVGLGWVSLLLIARDAAHRETVRVIASSFYTGPRRAWIGGSMPRIGAIVSAFVDATDEPGEKSGAASVSGRTTDRADSSGSGFFINATDVVTNRHVVEGCARLATADGAVLEIVATDRDHDLALLQSSRRSRAWLSIAHEDALLGANVFVLGYPLYGAVTGDLSATRGVLSNASGFLGDRDTFTLSAQIQPGNSGGPVLNRKGEVVGVVVARISDAAVAKATGTIPQNVNFAITRQNLLEFLGEALGPVALSAGSSADLDDGIPRELQDAVIPIVCEAR